MLGLRVCYCERAECVTNITGKQLRNNLLTLSFEAEVCFNNI
jgi:hypothetical protein